MVIVRIIGVELELEEGKLVVEVGTEVVGCDVIIVMGVAVVLTVADVVEAQNGRRVGTPGAKLILTSTLDKAVEGAFAVIWRKPDDFYENEAAMLL